MPDDIAGMMRDIRLEVQLTKSWIGKEHLDARVLAAMEKVPRHEFVPQELDYLAYSNGPLAIGHGQTISQPYIVALMTDLLRPQAEDVVLEVGTGSGYQAAVLSLLVKQVYSVEIVAALAQDAATRLRSLGYSNVSVRGGDGYRGWPEHAPFDAIIVTAAAPTIPPPLLEQLKPGGRMVIPVGAPYDRQILTVIDKSERGDVTQQTILPVAFVPLTGKHGKEFDSGSDDGRL
jgi:protein-L-isoaspartate(D-aspartate) O-methyltransferase